MICIFDDSQGRAYRFLYYNWMPRSLSWLHTHTHARTHTTGSMHSLHERYVPVQVTLVKRFIATHMTDDAHRIICSEDRILLSPNAVPSTVEGIAFIITTLRWWIGLFHTSIFLNQNKWNVVHGCAYNVHWFTTQTHRTRKAIKYLVNLLIHYPDRREINTNMSI